MADVVALWVYLSATPLFGLTATLVTYVLAHAVYQRTGQAVWANPVLWSVLILACLLLATGVSYPGYFSGAQFIHFLLGPAVVALGWPLWQRRAEVQNVGGVCSWPPWSAARRPADPLWHWAGPWVCPAMCFCPWRPSP